MKYKWFTLSEFDSPDKPGSGEMMEETVIQRLDIARDIAGFPFIITSGFRTVMHNRMLKDNGYKVSENSSHLLGYAVDIYCENSKKRFLLIEALMDAGFTRIGIAETFIHVDSDPEKPNLVIWTY